MIARDFSNAKASIDRFLFFSSVSTNENLEEKLEELRKQLDDAKREVEIQKRKNERLQLEEHNRKEEQLAVAIKLKSEKSDYNLSNLSATQQNVTEMSLNFFDDLFLP